MSAEMNLTHAECANRAAAVTVDRYRVELDLSDAPDPQATTFTTVTTIEFAATADSTWVDLVADRIDAAELNGRPLDISGYDGARLPVDGLAGQNTLTVTAGAAYSRSGEGLHRFTDPQDGNTYLYTHFEPTDARRVFACFEQPDLKGRFTFVVTAPASWEILSGGREATRATGGGVTTVTFEPTPPLSTYLTAVAAGPYHRVDGQWTATDDDGIELAVLCRRSMADHLDAAAILRVTGASLTFYHSTFGYRYPWGKYHQIFVPEYNIGAMENPGLVTFTEQFLPRGTATSTQLESRAEVIGHEMAHMWFGDLVTMRWWDGLWLKESFADLMGYLVADEAAGFGQAWTSFAAGRKQWAYRQDQLPTTHPIEARIDDLEAARQNFDGITYAKGAAVLKQLLAYVGREAFFAGSRSYFDRFAYGNTELDDLLGCLQRASGRDLAAWSAAWLQTAGTCELTPVVERDVEGRITRLVVHRSATDPATSAPVQRPHRLRIGLYARRGGGLERERLVEVDLDSDETEIGEVIGGPGDLVLVNDDDLSYATVRLDPASMTATSEHLSSIDSTLSRSLLWSVLHNACRDGQLPAADYLAVIARQLPAEPDPTLIRIVAEQARTAVERFTLPAGRDAARSQLLSLGRRALAAAEAGSDAQLTWARALMQVAATTPEGIEPARALLDGRPDGLRVDADLRWSAWTALAAQNAATDDDLDQELRRDDTMTGRTAALRARCSRPGVAEATWETITTDRGLTNDQLRAMVAGFARPGADRSGFAARYFAALTDWWRDRSMVMASILVGGLFPVADLDGSGGEQDHPVVSAARTWLEDNPAAPVALRRIVIEHLDDARRALRVQGMSPVG